MLEIEQTGGCLNTMDIKLGYQIYSAREEAEKDLAGVCEKLKAFGYDGVEFAGFYGYTAEQINEILAGISQEEREAIMQQAVENQPVAQ